jgi:hypothetical protein
MSKRCQGYTLRGERCKNYVIRMKEGRTLCNQHLKKATLKERLKFWENEDKEICNICMDEKPITVDNDALLVCKHKYHTKCIINLHDIRCPTCRSEIDSPRIYKIEKSLMYIKKLQDIEQENQRMVSEYIQIESENYNREIEEWEDEYKLFLEKLSKISNDRRTQQYMMRMSVKLFHKFNEIQDKYQWLFEN